MQTVSPQLTAACSAYGQRPCLYVEFSWDRSGEIGDARGATGWTDETQWVKADRVQLAINPPGERLIAAGSVGSGRLDLWNRDGRFSWQNPASALYAHIGQANSPAGPIGVPVRIWRGYITTNGAEYVCVFTGAVSGWKETAQFVVSFQVRDWGWIYMQNRLSLPVSRDQLPHQWIGTVADEAGIAAGEMSLEVGVLPIPFVWMDKEGAVDEIWTTAEADGGMALFDQRGILRYWNPLHFIGQAVVWDFAEDGYTLSEPDTDARQLATEVTVEWSPRFEGVDTDLYTLDELRVLMPGETDTWEARFNYAAIEIYAPDAEDPYNDYHATSAGGADVTDNVAITLLNSYGQAAEVQAVNNDATQAARLTYLRLRGQPLVGGPSEEITVTVTPAPLPFPWQRTLRSNTLAGQGPWSERVQGNIYVQSKAQGAALAELLAVRCRQVRPIWTLRQVWGIPQLELGDLVRFVDTRTQGSQAPVEALVVGITWGDEGGGGYIQTLRLMELGDLSEYDDYFIIGTSELGDGPGADRGRLWY